MFTLRLTQSAEGPERYRVDVELEGGGQPRQSTAVRFDFGLAPQQQEDLRWYLEDYLRYPLPPAPRIAARVEAEMGELGRQVFRLVFDSGDARDLWAVLRPNLSDTRVEIVTDVVQAAAIPWELIRDSKTDAPLALRAQSFVRAHPQAAERPALPRTGSGPIRILLVICRPSGGDDVPFRSVAAQLVKGLSAERRPASQLDILNVLRPPTFEQLGRALRSARNEGRPYHIVHFDGHGLSVDPRRDRIPRWLLLSPPQDGSHGYLSFENPDVAENRQLVDGPALGRLLYETGVPYLVLNACRSAHADVQTEPEAASTGDPHAKVRAFGSLAQEVMDAGALGVVAMRYNVYVVTAAQFVANLYRGLVEGHSLGEAVTAGRKQLNDQPLREIAFEPRPLQDWTVPVVYEAAAVPLFPKPEITHKPTIILKPGAGIEGERDSSLPPRPDAGFFGRDATLLALDRAFDRDRIVLLWAYAGSGKTTTAAEFARWYTLTGGLRGKVLFSSFQQYRPLAQVLNDVIERAFRPTFEEQGVKWLTLNDAGRRDVTLQILEQAPVLWIWDNVEPIAGFPSGAPSPWKPEEQEQLREFLRAAGERGARFLLTSRRDEEAWLGQLPTRVTLPPMPFLERVQLARALAEKQGHKLAEVEDWRPLLEFTGGNPLTVTVMVNQALRDGLRTRQDIEAFVTRLRAGESAFTDEASEGRTKSLGASLSYGFENAFDESGRRRIALLHFFQQSVHVGVLGLMGDPESDFRVPEIGGLSPEAWIILLDRAAEGGLLTALRGGRYSIHPALPWYFKDLFERYYPDAPAAVPGTGARDTAMRSFAECMAEVGRQATAVYQNGNQEAVRGLAFEEANLLHARELAKSHGWWGAVIGAMYGLFTLYQHKGRWAEWQRLVDELKPCFVDDRTEGPLPGREGEWQAFMDYRIRLAQEVRNWAEAERLQNIRVEHARALAAAPLAADPKSWDDDSKSAIYSLAVALNELGLTQLESENPACEATLDEVVRLAAGIEQKPIQAMANLNLGIVYARLVPLLDLDKAETCLRRGLELPPENDRLSRSRFLNELGFVALVRYRKASQLQAPNLDELVRHLNDARGYYQKALAMAPPDALTSLGVTRNQLGEVCDIEGHYKESLDHYQEAIRCFERSDNFFHAGESRMGAARMLHNAQRPQDALDYARAALDNLKPFGPTKVLDDCQTFITEVGEAMNAKGR